MIACISPAESNIEESINTIDGKIGHIYSLRKSTNVAEHLEANTKDNE
jgi:hypothetical protein